jgi:hypothetical protein
MRICAAFFAIAALGDVWDVTSWLAGWNDEPYSILVIHSLLFVVALAAAIGLWRATRWSIGVVVLWGVCTAAFIVALGPILALDAAARSGLWVGAATVLVIALVIAAYARKHVPGAPLGAGPSTTA